MFSKARILLLDSRFDISHPTTYASLLMPTLWLALISPCFLSPWEINVTWLLEGGQQVGCTSSNNTHDFYFTTRTPLTEEIETRYLFYISFPLIDWLDPFPLVFGQLSGNFRPSRFPMLGDRCCGLCGLAFSQSWGIYISRICLQVQALVDGP